MVTAGLLEDTRPDLEDWMEGPENNPFSVSDEMAQRLCPLNDEMASPDLPWDLGVAGVKLGVKQI